VPASYLVIQAVIADTLLKIVMAFPQEKTTSSTSDVTRHAIYDLQTEQFNLRKDLAFTRLLLADEINRASAPATFHWTTRCRTMPCARHAPLATDPA